MKAITGLLPLWAGGVQLDGQDVGALPAHQRAAAGIGYIPQGRRLFTELTVAQNLEIGLMARKSPRRALDRALELFPRLKERLSQRAETLSGGEQQMLATARALCVEPKVLLLDEPTEGLQPSMIDTIRDVILRLRDEGTAILLVEQRIDAVLSVADQVTFIENGQGQQTFAASELDPKHQAFKLYLGV
ncbi:Branched-chain amino acid transport ATP-binding protein LivF [Candidatus Rhodobacter oscarellae]|uniref:Branched-chain amino acid transport ATP-binding protein LivF n=2 Tax=Candidatus Rhodobacter oscarellae TaxID=1675527 RepID=A0A0J9EBV3_9RHOB|nr:Branched-chain amino acid transport ATP-binding protein LivF [Candidatus Rhodobacter lobularis]